MELKGKKVLVFGAGKSGIGAADLLGAVGANTDSFRKLILCDFPLRPYRPNASTNTLVVDHSTALPDSDTCIVSTKKACYNNLKIQMYY